MWLADASTDQLFGRITPAGALTNTTSATGQLGGVIGNAIRIAFVVAAIYVLYYCLWGAYDWIMSGGDEKKLESARGKISSALIGIVIMVVVMVLWVTVAGNILGLVTLDSGGFSFSLPTLGN